MKAAVRIVVFLHIFIGIGACAGGLGAILDPAAPMGAPAEMLRHSPFRTFLIPGLFLFVVLGIGNLLSYLISRFFKETRGYLACVMGLILCLWLIIQCIFIRGVAALHIIFFVIGIVQGGAGCLVLFFSRQFPYYDVLYFFKRRQDKKR